MKWLPVPGNTMALVSDCGRYAVCKIGGANKVYRYEAWRSVKHEKGRLCLERGLPDANTAKALCEGDR